MEDAQHRSPLTLPKGAWDKRPFRSGRILVGIAGFALLMVARTDTSNVWARALYAGAAFGWLVFTIRELRPARRR